MQVHQFDPIPAATRAYLDAEERAAETTAQAHNRLFVEMAEALNDDPAREVSAPAYRGTWTAARIVADEADADMIAQLIRIVAMAARAPDPGLRYSACAWIAGVAKRYADFHRDIAAEDVE